MNNTARLDKAIEIIIKTSNRFNGKDNSCYCEAYKAELLMNEIPEARWKSNFTRVITPSLHVEVLELQTESHGWEEFERGFLEV